ncbi:FecCD family ABC transporter permease [Streptomyces sp. NPDC004838]
MKSVRGATGQAASPALRRRHEAIRLITATRRARHRRTTAVCVLLAAALLVVFTASLCFGDVPTPVGEVLRALTGQAGGGTRFVVIELRLPRSLLALLVGCAFGISGALFQALLRNPLASPDVIGVSQGASAAAVVASVGLGLSGMGISLAALAGALLSATAIYALAWRRGVSGQRFVLIGIGVGAALSSIVSYLLTSAEVTRAQDALVWLTGSLNGSALDQVWPLLAALAVLLPLTAMAHRHLGALELGDDTAAGLGTPVNRSRLALLGCAVALAGVATAAAGPVAFVALIAAPVARRLAPAAGAAVLPAALAGGVLVAAADFIGQHLLWSSQFPVGVVTGLIGAPYLLWLLARTNRAGGAG